MATYTSFRHFRADEARFLCLAASRGALAPPATRTPIDGRYISMRAASAIADILISAFYNILSIRAACFTRRFYATAYIIITTISFLSPIKSFRDMIHCDARPPEACGALRRCRCDGMPPPPMHFSSDGQRRLLHADVFRARCFAAGAAMLRRPLPRECATRPRLPPGRSPPPRPFTAALRRPLRWRRMLWPLAQRAKGFITRHAAACRLAFSDCRLRAPRAATRRWRRRAHTPPRLCRRKVDADIGATGRPPSPACRRHYVALALEDDGLFAETCRRCRCALPCRGMGGEFINTTLHSLPATACRDDAQSRHRPCISFSPHFTPPAPAGPALFSHGRYFCAIIFRGWRMPFQLAVSILRAAAAHFISAPTQARHIAPFSMY